MILTLILIPFFTGAVSFFIRRDVIRRGVLLFSAAFHLGLTVCAGIIKPQPIFGGWFALDSLGILFLGITTLLFSGAAVYGIAYLTQEKQQARNTEREGILFYNVPEAVFSGCLLLFLGTMTTAILSQHFAVFWAAMEATTLVSAPLIYFHRHQRSLEAAWKYLLICSVGIALALLGTLFLAVAGLKSPGILLLKDLIAKAPLMDIPWLQAAFLFLFVGYGTKMGLAPLHTWLPDAHSEAPSIVSALLSGALLNCAFLGILRVYLVCISAGLQSFCQEIFILFGLLSILFAAFFILGQTDYKRMLAYSSIEHMGVLALGTGLGAQALFGVLLNTICHSLTKAGLFFIAGNILAYYRTKSIADAQGILKEMRWSGALWLGGFFLITGTPPSGIFLSKFIILKSAVEQGHYWISFLFIMALAVIFIGMARIFIPMAYGTAEERVPGQKQRKDTALTIVPSLTFFALVIILGLYLPKGLTRILNDAVKMFGGF
ncbi:MAG: proton-conducting transporter membrane subunit [Candidatus Omnitrophota bacterium]